MKRVCLFAGYDKNNIIHDYVVYYIKELSLIADVYYMADNNISDEEKAKIAPYTKGAYGFNHKKYDFGSWQELIKIIGWEKLSEYDELILANDSVFGPLYPITELFNKIEQDKQWDVCGINKHNYKKWHLSSYFLVFRNRAFTSDIFKNHIESIQCEKKNTDVIDNYEVPFMEKFYKSGYMVKSYMGQTGLANPLWKEYVLNHIPFIKKKAFQDCSNYKDIAGWQKFIVTNTSYPLKLMESYLVDIDDIVKKKQFYETLKNIRKNLIRINIKKDRVIVKLFGITLINTRKNKCKYIADTAECPIKTINS